jgi:hypothetical protein
MYQTGISLLLAISLGLTVAVAPGTARGTDTAGDAKPVVEPADPNQPIITAPSSIDLSTAKFGRLEITLTDASFLDAQAREIKLSAENMDLTKGTLDSLSVFVDDGQFQEFIVDSTKLWTHGALNFDTGKLLNDKILEFREPASAHARVSVTQASLNKFLNASFILSRLSGAAKKRVPILSSLARHDVNFGFTFSKADLKLQPDSHIRLSMDSKVGMGKGLIPVTLSAEARLILENGWVKLEDTHFVTGGQAVPKDMAEKIVQRINSLSKWGQQSDDIQFQFTDLNMVPDDHLELEGSATIKRLRFTRNQEDKITAPQAAPETEQPTETRK